MTLHEETIAPLLDKLLEAGGTELILTGELKPQLLIYKKGFQEYADVEGADVLPGQSLNEVIRSMRLADRSDTGTYTHKGHEFRYALTPGAILFRLIPSAEQVKNAMAYLAETIKLKNPGEEAHNGLRTATDVFSEREVMTGKSLTTEDRVECNRRYMDFIHLNLSTVQERLNAAEIEHEAWAPRKNELEIVVKASDANKMDLTLNYHDGKLITSYPRFDSDVQGFLRRFFQL